MEFEGGVQSFAEVRCKMVCTYRRERRQIIKDICENLDAVVLTVSIGLFGEGGNVVAGVLEELEHVLVCAEYVDGCENVPPIGRWDVEDQLVNCVMEHVVFLLPIYCLPEFLRRSGVECFFEGIEMDNYEIEEFVDR